MASKIDENTQFVGINGKPLNNGKIYIGEAGLDPVLNPITIYSDRALSVALANPQTLNSLGRPGSKIWIPGRYSMRVEDEDAVLSLSDLDAGEAADSGITAISNVQGTNAITGEGTPTITEYTDKELYIFIAANDITGAVTLNWDAVGAKALKSNYSQDMERNYIKQGQLVIAAWNEGDDYFEWVNHNDRVFYGTEGADIASAATINLALATGNSVTITGATGPVTSFGTVKAGAVFFLTFASTPTINHNGTSLKIPGETNRTVVAGERWVVKSLGSGNWEVVSVFPTDGSIVAGASQALQEAGSNTDFAVTPGVQHYHPSAAKFWVNFTGTGTVTINGSYNVTSITDNGTGNYTVNVATDFSSTSWVPFALPGRSGGNPVSITEQGNPAAGAMNVLITKSYAESANNAPVDVDRVYAGGFGDQ